MNNTEDQENRLWGDVNDYGIFLIELITGKSARLFQKKKGLSLIDWAIPYLENGSLNQVMDPRLMEMSSDSEVVNHIARAALLCLNNNAGAHKFSISEVCFDLLWFIICLVYRSIWFYSILYINGFFFFL
ncbi:hypothetical protein HYC85_024362 [Camellia sinensis]|uniref:Serine-threonine/tyrosine-protein kinase catalytic domain-containing protein n=1 Tax=Camellia sinensis TaxID=4442 RepID=A0A7J7GC38_CAMSI|nr:hypothetical protein HYC85_024362 [Camellia sinensis]